MEVPFTPEEIQKINEVMSLPEGERQEKWEELVRGFNQEQLNYISEQQKQQQSSRGGCIFCEIIAGKVPSKKVYDSEKFIGVLDIHPANKGHVIVMPKKHYSSMLEMEDVGELFNAVNMIAKKMKEVLNCDVNVFVADGKNAGQVATHLLVHVIPRFENDGVNLKWNGKEVPEAELDELIGKLKVELLEKSSQKSELKPASDSTTEECSEEEFEEEERIP